jgi:hypothetical protein
LAALPRAAKARRYSLAGPLSLSLYRSLALSLSLFLSLSLSDKASLSHTTREKSLGGGEEEAQNLGANVHHVVLFSGLRVWGLGLRVEGLEFRI